jgi:hypothetical protein
MSAISCKFCGVDGLSWKQVAGKWLLIYPSGQTHLCRQTREKIAKKIAKPTAESVWDLKALAKWEAKQPVPEPPPREPFAFTDPWFNFLDGGDPRPRIAKTQLAKQETFEELIP